MNILNKLSIQNLKLNKKRSIGTVIGIILSVALICAVAGMFSSFRASLVRNVVEETGYYHMEMSLINDDILSTLKLNRNIDKIMTSYEVGTSYLENDNKDNPYITVRATDYFDELKFKIIEGHKPTNSNELVINTKTAKEAHLSIGDTIELNLGTRVTSDNYPLHESNPYNGDAEGYEEYIKDPVKKTYKIVGIFSRSGYGYNHAGITTGTTTPTINAFIALKEPSKMKEFEEYVKEIVNSLVTGKPVEKSFSTSNNYELLRWEIFAFSDDTISMLYTVVGIVIFIILVTSVFCIRNSFAISATEKSKMLGMLASVGATKKQIRRSVLTEAFILGIFGIPV